jgi:predicted metal-binding membrane protein
VGALLVCAAAAWAVTIRDASSMSMTGAGLFLVTWVVMMVAMMFPSVAPMTLAFAGISRKRGDGLLPAAGFVFGYLVVWAAVGLIPLAVIEGLNQVWMNPPTWLGRAAGAVIVIAGVYQFTPLKNACLRACRSPLGFIVTHDFGRGLRAAAQAGAAHGLYCLGCCWALMAVLAVLGLMNVAWMAVITAVFFVEKNVRFGERLPILVGVVCVVAGVLLIVL